MVELILPSKYLLQDGVTQGEFQWPVRCPLFLVELLQGVAFCHDRVVQGTTPLRAGAAHPVRVACWPPYGVGGDGGRRAEGEGEEAGGGRGGGEEGLEKLGVF